MAKNTGSHRARKASRGPSDGNFLKYNGRHHCHSPLAFGQLVGHYIGTQTKSQTKIDQLVDSIDERNPLEWEEEKLWEQQRRKKTKTVTSVDLGPLHRNANANPQRFARL